MIDEIDKEILIELQADGRQSFSELARKVGLVEGAIRKRFKRLLKEGIVKIVAVPNLQSLGYGFGVIMGIQVKIKDLRKVANRLAQNKHLCYIALVTGTYDMIAIAFVRSREDLLDIDEKQIATIPGVVRVESYAILDIVKGGWGILETLGIITGITMKK